MGDKKVKESENGSFGAKLRQFLSDVVYGLFRFLLQVIFHCCFRVRVVGLENCPPKGPLLVVCNHISDWDPPFLGSVLPWQVYWLAKVELFDLVSGRMNPFFRTLHCIPVNREKADLSAVKQIVKLLKGSRPVVVFAEGGIRHEETSLLGVTPELKEGAATMALLSGAPILPVLLTGTRSLYKGKSWRTFRRHELEVVIGPVFQLTHRDRAEATEEIKQKMLALKPLLKKQQIC
jgi:1-acyl-sn-glycerol-3-phosphate acyltransferase